MSTMALGRPLPQLHLTPAGGALEPDTALLRLGVAPVLISESCWKPPIHQQDAMGTGLCLSCIYWGYFLLAVLSTDIALSIGDTALGFWKFLKDSLITSLYSPIPSRTVSQALCLVSLLLYLISYSFGPLKNFLGYTLDLIFQPFNKMPLFHF